MSQLEQNDAVSEHKIELGHQSRRRFGKRMLFGLPLIGAALAARQTGVAEAGSATDTWRMEGNNNVDSNDAIGSRNSQPLRFITSNIERLRIAASGNIGVGVTEPNGRVHVQTGQPVAIRAENSSSAKGIRAVLGVLTAQSDLQDAAAVKGVVESTKTGLIRPPESYGVWGEHRGPGGAGVYGNGNDFGVYGYALGGVGVQGFGQDEFIPDRDVTVIANGIFGTASGFGVGVSGGSRNGPGVEGSSRNSNGVIGRTFARDGNGVVGEATQFEGTGAAIFGRATGTNVAGRFEGNVQINGTLSKSAGSFKIDHPLDPANKYLSHSFVESPEMLNVYRGNVVLDGRGAAEVTLPNYFEALNVTYSYQLTAIGAPAPNLHVASEISGGRFTIAGGQAGQKICWQVTGARQDVYAKANPIVVEEDKPANERGTYLQPEAYGQGADKAQPAVVALAKQAAEAHARDEQHAQRIARR